MTDIVNTNETGSATPELLGGQGEPAPSNTRQSLQMLKQAVVNGWDMPDEWKKALPNFCMSIVADRQKGDRERLRATEILRAMHRDNLDGLQMLDKLERLEDGSATERIELAPIEWNPTR
jgi:hypothetical protein